MYSTSKWICTRHHCFLFLILNLIFAIPSLGQFSDDAIVLTLRQQEGIFLDTVLATKIDSGLAAARRRLDTLSSMNAFPEYVTNALTVITAASWTQAWKNGQVITGEQYIDSLDTIFGVTNVQDDRFNFYYLVFNQPLQMKRLAELYKKQPGVYAEPVYYCCDGDNIEMIQKHDSLQFAFSHGSGDCPAGCILRHYWYLSVPVYDHSAEATYEEEKEMDWYVPYIYRWNIPPVYAMTMFPNADSILHTIRHHPEWWVRRHAVEGTRRFFSRYSPWCSADQSTPWHNLQTELQSRRAEVRDTLRAALTDPDQDVRLNAAAAFATPLATVPTTLVFDNVDLGYSKNDSMMVKNISLENLVITSIATNDSEFTVFPTNGLLHPAASQMLHINFTPSSAGTKPCHIIFSYNGIASPESLSITGVGVPAMTIAVRGQWNLVSIPVVTASRLGCTLFPSANSRAYIYDTGYRTTDTMNTGRGYWLKFPNDQPIVLEGPSLSVETVDVVSGWNIIGSISIPIQATSITAIPGTMVTSQFFGYNNEYSVSDTIFPGQGYWVKANQDGKLILAGLGTLSKIDRIRIISDDELPPPAPDNNIDQQMPLPIVFSLSHNYPNPFNPSTFIPYSVPLHQYVSLKIYNVLGQEIATLVNGQKFPGNYQATWDASSFPSGVYFYRLSTKDFVKTKKLVLMK